MIGKRNRYATFFHSVRIAQYTTVVLQIHSYQKISGKQKCKLETVRQEKEVLVFSDSYHVSA